MEAFRKRYNTGLNEYYAWRAKANEKVDLSESVEYAKRLAGPEPKMEDF
jgi:hypothetical protein